MELLVNAIFATFCAALAGALIGLLLLLIFILPSLGYMGDKNGR